MRLLEGSRWCSGLVVLAALGATSGNAWALQGPGSIVFQRVNPPNFGINNGGAPGNTQVMGSAEDDNLWDKFPADTDVFYDAPGGSDGVRDSIDSKDGDSNDSIWAGPEDSIQGDSYDTVFILPKGGNDPLWSGSFYHYERARALVRWGRDVLQGLLEMQSGPAGPDFWIDALDTVSLELEGVDAVPGPDGAILFSDHFAIGPYEIVPALPPSPLDCLSWLPYGDEDPVAATADLSFTPSEYCDAVEEVKALLAYLRAQISD